METTKKCKNCNKSKRTDCFRKDRNDCKSCEKEKEKIYRLTKQGVIGTIYNNQKSNSKKRNHPAPLYSIDELREWIEDNSIFDELYSNWVDSEYKTNYKPSIDRIDDNKPYLLDNIQLMTWEENKKKGHKFHKLGIIDYDLKPVSQFEIDGTFIKSHISLSQAARDLNLFQTNISKACIGEYGTCGGYKWKFNE